MLDPLAIEHQRLGFGAGVVCAQHLDERSLARRAVLGHDDAKVRALLRTHAPHANYQHLNPPNPLSFFAEAPCSMPPIDFIILRICTNCFSRLLTSCTVVPLPFAMRLRRCPLIT